MKLYQRCIFVILLVVFTLSASQTMADEISEFWEIHSSVLEDYSDYAFKFTHVGSQLKIIPTLGGHGLNRVFDVDDFKPFHRNYHYSNDDVFVNAVIPLSNQEFKDFVDGIGANQHLQSTEAISGPSTSFMIIRDYGSITKCWEHLSTLTETRELFNILLNSIDQTRKDVIEILIRSRQHMCGK